MPKDLAADARDIPDDAPRDDLGVPVPAAAGARRVVSLVPSLTEALALTCPEVLVGATDWCTHPADLDVPRVRGTKNPDLRAIAALNPDVVIANKEENREFHVTRLRERGIPVWVTEITDVPSALASMGRLLAVLGHADPPWLVRANHLWAGSPPPPVRTVAMAVWRDPWMVVGDGTFAADLLRRMGCANAFADRDRYPRVELTDLDRPGIDAVLLPDEPYVFTAADGPEAFAVARPLLVSGRLLTWYGPALLEAHAYALAQGWLPPARSTSAGLG